ncbi:MAG: hypothetical protein WEC79_08220 [Thermomicrobiales bacterium]
MFELHRGIGEGLFLIYIIVIAVVYVMSRRGRDVPGWLTGVAHGLLALQAGLGVAMLLDGRRAGWEHPIIGVAAMLAIGTAAPLRARFGKTNGMIVSFAMIAVLAFAAWLTRPNQ